MRLERNETTGGNLLLSGTVCTIQIHGNQMLESLVNLKIWRVFKAKTMTSCFAYFVLQKSVAN